MSIYNVGLDKNQANHVALTPIGFLEHAATVYPDRISIIHETQKFTWQQTYARCRQLADAIQKRGVQKHDTVAIIAANVPAHIEMYFGVPMAKAVLNALNTRLDSAALAFMLDHSETKIIFVDRQFAPKIQDALTRMKGQKPIVVDIDDPAYDGDEECIGEIEYEDFLCEGRADFKWSYPDDEWEPIALHYTSGTTGDPKGVVYHHRGAYLNSFGNVYTWNMQRHPVYLWTLPAFHAGGWCFHWTITLMGGTHICLRKVDAAKIYDLIEEHNVTHLSAAPIVVNTIIHAPANVKRTYERTIQVMIAGSAPPAAVLKSMEAQGFAATHVYGATEAYGPCMSCEWNEEWDMMDEEERSVLKARQGVRSPVLEDMIIADPDSCEELPWDGKTIGECLMRGNVIMSGYLKNPQTTDKTFAGGWYHTGDLCVRHPNGHIEVKDRLKDIIISGGENISSLEVESVLYRHPAVLEAAVVAKHCDKWGETPCAFIELKQDAQGTTTEEIIDFCRTHMAGYKIPKSVIFGPIEKTSTGKIQKFALRERTKSILMPSSEERATQIAKSKIDKTQAA